MIPDVPTGAMHAVSDRAASTNESSLYALGPRMAAHYTRGSACEHMALRADDVSLLCALDECAVSHARVRRAALCPDPSRLSSWSVGPAAETPSSTGWRVSRGPGGGYRILCTTVGFSPADCDTRDDSMRLTAGLVTGHRGGLPEKMKMSGAEPTTATTASSRTLCLSTVRSMQLREAGTVPANEVWPRQPKAHRRRSRCARWAQFVGMGFLRVLSLEIPCLFDGGMVQVPLLARRVPP